MEGLLSTGPTPSSFSTNTLLATKFLLFLWNSLTHKQFEVGTWNFLQIIALANMLYIQKDFLELSFIKLNTRLDLKTKHI